jgi:hypothetical protein
MHSLRSSFRAAFFLVIAALATPLVHAGGTPLVCHPYQIGAARSLPAGHDFHGCTKTYDRKNLVPDTLALLTPDAPILVRMETLRRAALYAVAEKLNWTDYQDYDAKRAEALLAQLRTRADTAKGPALALALFDLGFFSETLRQGISAPLDGYATMVKAAELRGGDPAIEFALALSASRPRRDVYREHFSRARTNLQPGSLLAANLTLAGQ